MSLALLAFPGKNQVSPWWYELKVRASTECFVKGATLWALGMLSGRPHHFAGSQVLLTLFER